MSPQIFNRPDCGERRLRERDGYDVVEAWQDGAWRPHLWIYQDGDEWVISDAQPYWLNGKLPSVLYSTDSRDHAISASLWTGWRYLPHCVGCPCDRCNALVESEPIP